MQLQVMSFAKMKSLHARAGMSLFLTLYFCFYFSVCNGCFDEERRAFQEVLDSMDQPYYDTDDCCQWDGVDCSLTSSRVTRLFFYYIREEVELSFPDMYLFSQIKELQELHLTGNNIGGLLNPEALCTLKSLQQLDLSYNSIDDDVPSCLANMPSLRILNLAKNQFQGDLSFVSNLSKIEVIDVSYNLFQGLIPLSIFANLSKLSHLDLSYNHLLEVESESPTWHSSFQVQHLVFAGCNLNHRSRHIIPTFISAQYSLQTLDLSNNFLEGSFPSWMLHNVSSVLRLRGNFFAGQFPYVPPNMAATLVQLDISSNRFDGTLPLNISTFLPKLNGFNGSSNLFTGSVPPSLGKLQSLQHLDLSDNLFSGVIPSGLTQNSPLWYLNLSNNSLDGELLPRDCNMTQLRWLLLHRNHFIGNLPTCLSNSLSLLMLDARHNYLSGGLSYSWLLVSRSQMKSTPTPLFSELGALLLSANQFVGYIPRQLCQLQRLQFLDLSNNNFSGSIPSCLRNNLFWRERFQANSWVPTDFTTKGNSYSFQGIPLTLMSGIDLSANQLTGAIPVQLGDLQQIHSINLSHNCLTGDFPRSFKTLTNLESLDLSHNRLTGRIPPEISQMSTLSIFSVAYNDLSGKVPFQEQSSTFNENSYIGNPKLCGQPLQAECSDPVDDTDQGKNHEEYDFVGNKEELFDESLFFYSFVFLSYGFGFWIVIAPLCISKNWRRKYYSMIEGWISYFF